MRILRPCSILDVCYVGFDDDATLGDGSEEIVLGEEATIMKVEEFEGLKEKGI